MPELFWHPRSTHLSLNPHTCSLNDCRYFLFQVHFRKAGARPCCSDSEERLLLLLLWLLRSYIHTEEIHSKFLQLKGDVQNISSRRGLEFDRNTLIPAGIWCQNDGV